MPARPRPQPRCVFSRPNRMRALAVFALAALLLTSCGTATNRATSGKSSSPLPTASSDSTMPPRTRTTHSSRLVRCGSWSASSSPTGSALSSAHGEIRDCFGLGRMWIVLELGASGRPGGIDLYRCRTAGCAPSATEFQASKWNHVAPPFSGGVTLLGTGKNHTMIVDNAGHELLFHPRSGRFSSASN